MKLFLKFVFILLINLKMIENLIFKRLKWKNLTEYFSNRNLITNLYTEEKIICLNTCAINILCSTVLYSQKNECKLFNKLIDDSDSIPSFESHVYVKYPRNCKQIKRFNHYANNGVYDIDTPNGKINVFCEFELDSQGFTFLPIENLNLADNNLIKDIYLNQSVFSTKYLIDNQMNQKFILVQQLDQYSNQSIMISINKGYPSEKNSNFLKISMVNESRNVSLGQLSGFKANGNSFSYNATDLNYYRYFVFYNEKFLNLNQKFSCNKRLDNFAKFISYGLNSSYSSLLPNSFFFNSFAFQMGANGFLIRSDCTNGTEAYAFALGLK